jgi:large subunit ribosomal protein L19
MKAQKLTKETILSLGVRELSFATPARKRTYDKQKFNVGDSVRVAQKIKEGEKERIQYFEGDVIRVRHHGIATTFTVRKIGANSISVERIFPLFAPTTGDVVVVRRGDVCRAKLYYMRKRIGKAAQTKKRRSSTERMSQGIKPYDQPPLQHNEPISAEKKRAAHVDIS